LVDQPLNRLIAVCVNDLNGECLKLLPANICLEIIAPHAGSDQFASAPRVRETTRRIVFALAAFFLLRGWKQCAV